MFKTNWIDKNLIEADYSIYRQKATALELITLIAAARAIMLDAGTSITASVTSGTIDWPKTAAY
jgi:hypothetical protein